MSTIASLSPPPTPELPGSPTLSLRGQHRTTFEYRRPLDRFVTLGFDDNPIASFAGFPNLPDLRHLSLNSTLLTSFESAPYLPSLQSISLRATPLSHYPQIRLMCAIVFGSQLQRVTGQLLSKTDLHVAARLSSIAPMLRKGWLLTGVRPMRLYNPATRARLSFAVAKPPAAPAKTGPAVDADVAVHRPSLLADQARRAVGTLNASLAKEAFQKEVRVPQGTSPPGSPRRPKSGMSRRLPREPTDVTDPRHGVECELYPDRSTCPHRPAVLHTWGTGEAAPQEATEPIEEVQVFEEEEESAE
jgi:hypothetical protein